MVVFEKSRFGKYKICDKHFVLGLGESGWYIQESKFKNPEN